MISINLIRLSKYSYINKLISLDVTYWSFNEIKNKVYMDYSDFIKDDDINLWIYAGKLITEHTDLSTIIHPISVYIMTDIIDVTSTSLNQLYNTIMNLANTMNDMIDDIRPPRPTTYDVEFETMLDMGFTEESRVREALELAEGDIVNAIEIYTRM
jgi:hypothetical protein